MTTWLIDKSALVRRDDPIAVIAFTVTGGRIAAIDLIADPGKLRALTLPAQAPKGQPG